MQVNPWVLGRKESSTFTGHQHRQSAQRLLQQLESASRLHVRESSLAYLFNECAVSLPHPFQEQVVPRQAAPVLLQKVQADGQDAPQHVGEAAAQLQVMSSSNHTRGWTGVGKRCRRLLCIIP